MTLGLFLAQFETILRTLWVYILQLFETEWFFKTFCIFFTDDTNDNYEILGYIACCLVPIFSAIISIWNSQCTLVHPTAMMFWVSILLIF